MATKAEIAARRAMIAERFPLGTRIIEIAEATGIPYQTVVYDMRALGRCPTVRGPRKMGVRDTTRAKHSTILRAVQREPWRTLDSFGQQFGMCRERIRQIIKEAGLPPKPVAPTRTIPSRRPVVVHVAW